MLPDRIVAGPVTLRRLTPRDAPAVQRHAADARVACMTSVIPHPYPDGAAAEWIAAQSAASEAGIEFHWGIVPRAGPELVGVIGAHLGRETHDDVGYWVGVPHWGRGYATAALAALLDVLFRERVRDEIRATHLARNPASGRVMEKCGMVHVGDELRARGGRDELFRIRAIDRTRWQAAKASR